MQESQQPRRTLAQQMDEEYDESERADIYRRAAEIQAETLFADDDDEWSARRTGGGRARRGHQRCGAQSRHCATQPRNRGQPTRNRKSRPQQRAATRKKLAIGGAIAAGVVGLSLLTTQAKLSGAYAQVESTRAQVDNAIQRRHDLVPNLISVTKATLDNQRALIAQLEAANQIAQSARAARAGTPPKRN